MNSLYTLMAGVSIGLNHRPNLNRASTLHTRSKILVFSSKWPSLETDMHSFLVKGRREIVWKLDNLHISVMVYKFKDHFLSKKTKENLLNVFVITEVRKVLHDFYITRPEIIVAPIQPILLSVEKKHYQRVKESKEMIWFFTEFFYWELKSFSFIEYIHRSQHKMIKIVSKKNCYYYLSKDKNFFSCRSCRWG